MVVINMNSVQITVSTFIFCRKEDSFDEVKYFYHIMLSPESISLKSIIYHRKFRSFMGKISQTDEIVFYSWGECYKFGVLQMVAIATVTFVLKSFIMSNFNRGYSRESQAMSVDV